MPTHVSTTMAAPYHRRVSRRRLGRGESRSVGVRRGGRARLRPARRVGEAEFRDRSLGQIGHQDRHQKAQREAQQHVRPPPFGIVHRALGHVGRQAPFLQPQRDPGVPHVDLIGNRAEKPRDRIAEQAVQPFAAEYRRGDRAAERRRDELARVHLQPREVFGDVLVAQRVDVHHGQKVHRREHQRRQRKRRAKRRARTIVERALDPGDDVRREHAADEHVDHARQLVHQPADARIVDVAQVHPPTLADGERRRHDPVGLFAKQRQDQREDQVELHFDRDRPEHGV